MDFPPPGEYALASPVVGLSPHHKNISKYLIKFKSYSYIF
jgi:hypothetical protein